MAAQLLQEILAHGYLAIFFIIFLQELGIPTPIPNELSLFFFGYLSSLGDLQLPLVLVTAICAELSGSSLLYLICYFFGPLFARVCPRWLPIPRRKLGALKDRMVREGMGRIFICRLTPFVRGYASALAGLLRINPGKYLVAATAAACCSTTVYVMAGWTLAPFWKLIGERVLAGGNALLIAFLVLAIWLVIRSTHKPRQGPANETRPY